MTRTGTIKRTTGETDIALTLDLDGNGTIDIDTGIGFLDHMLHLFARHGHMNLSVKAQGDTYVDAHHTTEDVGICLGEAFRHAIGDKAGIRRYGNAFVPMDDALAQVVIDISNRPAFVLKGEIPRTRLGTLETETISEFLWKFALEARINLHVIVHYGSNTHHIIEAVFKAFARALDEASGKDGRSNEIPSTKGRL
ncbi:MAG: imidazoleglycerol-phosphate dehydratase HisB [Bacilli bacterium]